jgi:hypothetical protein
MCKEIRRSERTQAANARMRTDILHGMTRIRSLAISLAFISSPPFVAAQGVASPATPLAVAETFTIESKALGETRRINVYVPRTLT